LKGKAVLDSLIEICWHRVKPEAETFGAKPA